MAITPQTDIRLLKTPFEIDNKNQLTFSNITAQTNYFTGLPFLEEDNCTYQRKDNVIRFPAHIDNIINYNYVMYKNEAYTNKWFYAFITRMEYINDNLTLIHIQTDVFQTWQFDIIYKKMFVEREHVSDDTVGTHIIDESLQLGEYICNKKQNWLNDDIDENAAGYTPSLCVVMGATSKYDGTLQEGVLIDGIYAGLRYYSFNNDSTGITALNNWLEEYADASKIDAIQCMFMLPKYLCSGADRNDHLESGTNYPRTRYINHGEASSINKNIDFSLANLDGYVPVNNKLKTYPFCYMLCSNNSGTDVIYRYEDFYTKNGNGVKTIENPKFKIRSCLTPSGSTRLIPENYKGVAVNDEEGINMGKFPICSWNTDVYTNWLTQNGVNIGLSIAGSAISGIAGYATGNPIGIASGILGVANTIGEIYKESKLPPQANGNVNSGDVTAAMGKNDFFFYGMSIKKQYAKIIDDYFSAYGYKINDVKIPNITGRTNWNYVKTINCNILGDIPQEDLQTLKDMFNSGITFWHNASTFLDYSQSNSIIS